VVYTVPVAFEEFRQKLEPAPYNQADATARKDRLVEVLSAEFDVLDSFATGSRPRYTAVRGVSDLDIMVVLHYNPSSAARGGSGEGLRVKALQCSL
jgi:hypothetical protein